MTESFGELRERYDRFLRQERYGITERIATTIDDYAHHTREKNRGTVWGCPRLPISMAELQSEDDGRLSQQMRTDPLPHMRALEAACHLIAQEERPGYDKEGVQMKIALSGPVGASPSCPRSLTSAVLRQLVCVEGVATKISTIKPKVVKSVHYCPATNQHEPMEYVDATDPQLGLRKIDATGVEMPNRTINITTAVYPTKDKNGNALETEFGLSEYKDHQTVSLQEMPERAPMGQLPRSVELVLDHDLVDKIKPGDRVCVVGVYRALATSVSGQSTSAGVFKTVVLVNNVQILGRDATHLTFSPQDIRTIKSLAKRKDMLNVLGRSISPSIYGHSFIKKALILQLLSGCEKNLKNGTHLRGDINILMVGDPSTAKSQLLRSTMNIAPLAVSTTGKGSSGVGLTAAVTTDPDTRERRLEAGAMVLADRGIVCVDEFDKMGESDRVSIHEAMEQQTVTIAKAGMHASLNARCSVLAAANPVYGQYDRRRRVQENIGLPDSLLSRFDLLFVVLDQMDPETDRRIASHVIKGHSYKPEYGRRAYDSDYDDENSDDDYDINDKNMEQRAHSVWQSKGHGITGKRNSDDDSADGILQHDFLRKFIHFAKTRVKPVLTDSAREFIANRYAEMRCKQDERTLPVTARTLETIIRLSTAHAKIRLSNTVEAEPDCEAAIDILNFALYHENNEAAKIGTQLSKIKEHVEISADEEELSEGDSGGSRESKRSRLNDNGALILKDLKGRLWEELSSKGSFAIDEVICDEFGDRATVMEALNSLSNEQRLMISDGFVYQLD